MFSYLAPLWQLHFGSNPLLHEITISIFLLIREIGNFLNNSTTASTEARLKKRHAFLKPLFVNFYEWLGTFTAVPKSKLATVVKYALKLR